MYSQIKSSVSPYLKFTFSKCKQLRFVKFMISDLEIVKHRIRNWIFLNSLLCF